MERFMKPCDKEYMRLAMLKHEQTFKEQVYEMHRLYRIQKLLMRNIDNNNNYRHNDSQCDQETWSSKNIGFCLKQSNIIDQSNNSEHKSATFKLDFERRGDGQNQDLAAEPRNDNHRLAELIDESEIELTLGPANYSTKTSRQGINKPETPLNSDSGLSFSSSSTGSSQIKKSTRNMSLGEELGVSHELGLTVDGRKSATTNNTNTSSDVVDQERLKQPPWLFQALSLRT